MVCCMLAPMETADTPRRTARVVGVGPARLAAMGCLGLAAAAAAVLSLHVLGVPGSLVLLGGWLLAAACHRVVPGLQGTVSWAAGVLLEVGLLAGLSAVVAKLSPHQHGASGNLAILAVPIAVALLVLAAGFVRDRRTGQAGDGEPAARVTARPGIALVVLIAGLALITRIAAEGHLYGVSWAMSGDARNHVVIIRSIIASGGLTLNLLRTFPGAIDAIGALISGAGGRAGLAPGHLVLHDAQSLASLYILSGLAIALLGIAALLELLPRATAAMRTLPAATYIALLASSGLSVTGLVLGTAVRDGYVSAYASIPLSLAAMVIGLACCRRGTAAAYALLGPAVVLTLFSWTILAVAPAAVTLWVTVLLALRGRHRFAAGSQRRTVPLAWVGALLVTGGCLLASALVVVIHLTQLRTTFKDTGAITAPEAHLVYLLGLLAAGGALGARRRLDRLQLMVPAVAAAAGGASLVWLMGLSPDHKSWTYYGEKQLWLLASCLVWVLFIPIVRSAAGDAATGWRWGFRPLGAVLQAVAWSLAVLIGVGETTTLPGPVTLAGHGWNQPSAAVIADMETAADQGRPVILWGWSDPGNQRLANFWSALAWGYSRTEAITPYAPALPGGIVYWAYVEQDTPADLCAAAKSIPGLVVVSHAKDLAGQLRKSCPKSRATVVLSPAQHP
jgi:hypothetical protein